MHITTPISSLYTIGSSCSLYNQRPFKRFQNIVSTKIQQLCDSFVIKFRLNEYSPASFVFSSIRTTTAVTKIYGGKKMNALPSEVKAYINHRVHPKDTFESILEYDK
eukprot:scaffold4640_cov283-Chaetoceros_neogracile.AAC.16